MEIELSKPIQQGDQTIDKLILKMDDLDGNTLIEAEREARLNGDQSVDPLFSAQGLIIIAAKASGVVTDDLKSLPACDFLYITNYVRNFLYGWVLPKSKQSEIYEK